MARARCIGPTDARVWNRSGRFGPRRVRVDECAAVLTAEQVYTELLRSGPARVRPGGRGRVEWTLPMGVHPVGFELRQNAVWRFGRVFLACPMCGRRSTRMYAPSRRSTPGCRRCWGLTYESRQQRNYKDGAGDGVSLRELARLDTRDERDRREMAARQRYDVRRAIVGGRIPAPT